MPIVLKVGLAGTGLAAITAGLGLYGIRDWSGETGGHWIALTGFTLLFPLMVTRSWLLAALIHWAVCLAAAGSVWGAIRLARSAVRGTPAAAHPVPPPAPMPDPWVPPTAESIARVVSGHGGVSPPRETSAEPCAAADLKRGIMP